MNLIFISIFLLIVLSFCFSIFLYLKIEKIEEKQEKEYQHILKNIHFVEQFLKEKFK